MTNESDIEQLFSSMLQLGKLMSQQTQETHEEKAATMLQFLTLQSLKERPNGTVTDLCNVLNLSKSSATQLIERLVKSGLVGRVDDTDDRRIIRLHITQNGEKEFTVLKKKLMDRMLKTFSRIPAKDVRELVRIHTNLIQSLKKDQR